MVYPESCFICRIVQPGRHGTFLLSYTHFQGWRQKVHTSSIYPQCTCLMNGLKYLMSIPFLSLEKNSFEENSLPPSFVSSNKRKTLQLLMQRLYFHHFFLIHLPLGANHLKMILERILS